MGFRSIVGLETLTGPLYSHCTLSAQVAIVQHNLFLNTTHGVNISKWYGLVWPFWPIDLTFSHQITLVVQLETVGHFSVEVYKCKYKCKGDRAFSVVPLRLWNELSISIRLDPSVSAFKSILKTYLFDKAYNLY